MTHARSIRFRLTLWYAVILSAALALFGGLIWLSLRNRLISELDENLAASAARFESYFKSESMEAAEGQLRTELEEFCQALPPSSYIFLHGQSGFVFRYPAGAARPGADFRMLRIRFSSAGETFDLDVGVPMREDTHTLNLLRLLLLSLLPVVIAIASLGGWWLSGRALKPVQELTAAAHTISIENLSGRLPVPDTGDELARLGNVLNVMLERLEAAVNTLSQFAADASHELRTPLAVIRTTAELALRRERPAEEYRESLQDVMVEAERMTKLIEDLLILARSDTGTADMPLEPVELREVIHEVCEKMRSLAELRQIRIQMSLSETAMISGNRAALERLFLVLVDNALKYSGAGGEVFVAVRGEAAQVAVTIQDSGAGISEADLPHIFKRFYRADRSRSSAGHGLGLALAESIARAHGASIQVESREGEGSRFSVLFARRMADGSGNLQLRRVSSSK
jgi:two-component system heavy metal sensor histidine kinase CusS